MDPSEVPNVGPVRPGQHGEPGNGPPRTGHETEFRRMLERLESIARQAGSPKGADGARSGEGTAGAGGTEGFLRELKQADQDFATVMDLRRKLEEAYKRSQP